MLLCIFIFCFFPFASGKLDFNCTHPDGTPLDFYSCTSNLRNAFEAFVGSDSYSSMDQPVADYEAFPLDLHAALTFNNVVEINQAQGYLKLSIFLDLYWKDNFLSWDVEDAPLALQLKSFYISPDLIWTPDFQLYNTQANFMNDMVSSDAILNSDGTIWWSRPGIIALNCNFELDDFPFDTQKCEMDFASFKYEKAFLDLYFTDPSTQQSPTIILTQFSDQQYEIVSVSEEKSIREYYKIPFAVLTWTLTLRRYPNFYISRAVVPSAIITSVCIVSLWIDNVNQRLSISVTALLTVVAIQVVAYVDFFSLIKLFPHNIVVDDVFCFTCYEGFNLASFVF